MTAVAIWRRLGALLLGLAAALLCPGARAGVPVALYKSFVGNVNFTGTEVTVRTGQTACDTYSAKTKLSKALTGIPTGSQVLAAYLYWAGSDKTPDNKVTFDGKAITAQRKYTSHYTNGGTDYDYFADVADVTAQVAAKGNGTYTFFDLTINQARPHCGAEGAVGGFSLLVVYSNPNTEPFRALNLYEGFQIMQNNSLSLSVGNLKIPNPLGAMTGRVGHIAWGGDVTPGQQGENLSVNGTAMTDSINPPGNQFNSRSNIDGDTKSYGIDFDAYSFGYPVIQPGQTSATTVYSSGQDIVLLNAEIIAVPNVPIADLAITMTRSGDPTVGQNLSYALGVTNNGPNTETGPVTVTDTLPAGMSFVSVAGSGWACSTLGQTATCTYNGRVAQGATLPAITVTATVLASGGGTYTNTAAVSGMAFDNVSANNSASDTSVDPLYGGAAFAVTDKPCTDGVPIATGSATGCHRIGPLIAGASQAAYITALDNGGVPAAPSKNGKATTVTLSLTCVNPASAGLTSSGAKVQAIFYTNNNNAPPTKTTLPACVNTSTTPVPTGDIALNFPANSPSAVSPDGSATSLYYPDVGLLQLNVAEGKNTASARFVSQPSQLSFKDILRPSDQFPNPGNIVGHAGFVMAGQSFDVHVKAETLDPGFNGGIAPNFGSESPPVALALGQSGTPLVEGTLSNPYGGIAAGSLSYPEVGDVTLTPLIATPNNDYLGSGKPVTGVAATVGRFYPAYFTTAVTPPFDCQPTMHCPSGKLGTGEDLGVSGAAYSGQAFGVSVTAYSMKNAQLFKYSGTIALSAVNQPGATGVVVATLNTISAAPNADGVYSTNSTFTLPSGYGATTLSAPTSIYLRAGAQDVIASSASSGTEQVTISSSSGGGTVADEDGLQVVVGRLQVSNAFGSELLKLAVPLNAQYWSDTSWDNNIGDDASQLSAPVQGLFTNCANKLSSGAPGPNNCQLLSVQSAPPNLTGGAATIYLAPPGRGNVGSGMMSISHGNPAWLPSTSARVVFGTNKSPLIYIREVY